MELVLHIGGHKTGTSAFQEILYNNRHHLGTGWFYPSKGLWVDDRSHNWFAIYFWDDVRQELKEESFPHFMDEFFDEIADKKNVIISAEMLEKVPLRGSIERLNYFIERARSMAYNIKIVYVVRRQDCLVDSIYKQWVLDKATMYSGSALELAANEIPHLVYSTLIDCWCALVGSGNVCVIPYLENDISWSTKTLLGVIGVNQERSELISNTSEAANVSLEGFALELKHLLNGVGYDSRCHDEIVSELFSVQARQQPIPRKSSMFDDKTREEFMRNFRADNASLRKYFPATHEKWVGYEGNFETFQSFDLRTAYDRIVCLKALCPYLHQIFSEKFS